MYVMHNLCSESDHKILYGNTQGSQFKYLLSKELKKNKKNKKMKFLKH